MTTVNVPKLQAFDPSTLVVNPAIRARRGEPNKDKVDTLAANMYERRQANTFHQIQPGVVRIIEENGVETVELIAGDHRRLAEIKLNANLGDGDERYDFLAIAVPANDTQALLDALDENEFRVAATVFDKGDAWSKLVALGLKQSEIAARYGAKESTVSDYIKTAKLPKKIQVAVAKGELTEEGAIALARYNKDPKLQEELFNLSTLERESRESIMARAEARSKGEPEPTESEPEAEETAPESKSSKSKVPVSEAVKNKPKTGGKKTATGKTTAADVKSAIKKQGVQKKKTDAGSRNTLRDLIQLLQARYGEKVADPVPEPYATLAGAIEEYYDGLGDQAFINRWEKCVRVKFAAAA